jgi:ADP-ribose pyrophosphatase YjhB (NUDIX family)
VLGARRNPLYKGVMPHFFRHMAERAKRHLHGLLQPPRLGVRCVVIAENSSAPARILLVRHTYIAGWYMPGGGVDPGESAQAAAIRELREETGFECLEAPQLHGFYFKRGSRDHVALYIVNAYRENGARAPDFEIAEMGFFPVDALPEDTSPATRARIAEIFNGAPATDIW